MGILIILFIFKKSWCKDFDFIHNVSISDCELYKNIIIVLWEIRGKFVRTDQLENQQNLIPNDHWSTNVFFCILTLKVTICIRKNIKNVPKVTNNADINCIWSNRHQITCKEFPHGVPLFGKRSIQHACPLIITWEAHLVFYIFNSKKTYRSPINKSYKQIQHFHSTCVPTNLDKSGIIL